MVPTTNKREERFSSQNTLGEAAVLVRLRRTPRDARGRRNDGWVDGRLGRKPGGSDGV